MTDTRPRPSTGASPGRGHGFWPRLLIGVRGAGRAGHADRVEWDQGLIDRLDLALNESTVCGLRYDAEHGEARLLVEVETLPEVGSIDQDPRRAIVLSSVESTS
jgi:hypothetical protein